MSGDKHRLHIRGAMACCFMVFNLGKYWGWASLGKISFCKGQRGWSWTAFPGGSIGIFLGFMSMGGDDEQHGVLLDGLRIYDVGGELCLAWLEGVHSQTKALLAIATAPATCPLGMFPAAVWRWTALIVQTVICPWHQGRSGLTKGFLLLSSVDACNIVSSRGEQPRVGSFFRRRVVAQALALKL